MHEVSDHAGSSYGSRFRRSRCCLPIIRTPSAPRSVNAFVALYSACTCPCQRLRAALAGDPPWRGAGVARCAFTVRLSHSLLLASLSWRFPNAFLAEFLPQDAVLLLQILDRVLLLAVHPGR